MSPLRFFSMLPRALSVRTLLCGLVAVAGLPPLIFAAVVLFRYADTQREQAERVLIDSAAGVARSVDAEFAAAAAALTALSTAPTLLAGDIGGFGARLRRTPLKRGHGFLLFDTAGAVLDTTVPPGAASAASGKTWPVPVFAEGDVFVSDVIAAAPGGEPCAMVAIPVTSDDGRRWALATFLTSGDFAELLRQPGVPTNWVVSIVDRQGVSIRRSHENQRFAGRSLTPDMARRVQARTAGIGHSTSLEGIGLIATVGYAPASGWAVAMGLPLEQLEAPLNQSLRWLTLVGAALTGLAVVLAFLAANLLLRGVRRLNAAAATLEQSGILVPQASPLWEIDGILHTLAGVSKRLAEKREALIRLNDTLETQVEQRTAALTAEMARREASEAQLRQLHKMDAIGKLTGGIAHDFNNMLAVVMSGMQLAKRRLARGDADVGGFIDSALQGAENAARLIERLLAFSRQQALRPETADCNRLIAQMSEMLRRTLPETVEIETVLAGGLWRAAIDVPGLENAILNLALNARDAMPDGGKLTIETCNAYLDEAYAATHADVTPGQYVMVAVSDTGTGIPPEMLDSVIEPFVTTKAAGLGTGLGLSQVHGFIKQSGGHIKLYSEVGQGTAVKLYLPRVVEDAAAQAQAAQRERPPAAAAYGATVLVVEDEALVRHGTVAMLAELGYDVREAASGAEALAVLAGEPAIELLLTDVVMPGMNGQQLATEAKRRWPHLKVLFATGYTRNAIVHHGRLDPGVRLIGKPYSLAALAEKVAEALRAPAG